MKFIVLHGAPAVGKLSVARELAELSGWKLFHNHLIVDALLAVFDFGSKPFSELRERMWFDVFAAASQSGIEGLIFTFNPENSISEKFLPRLVSEAHERGDLLRFIELTCAEQEIERRIGTPTRQSMRKLTSLELYRKLKRDGTFDRPIMPPSQFSFATDKNPPGETARHIWEALRSL